MKSLYFNASEELDKSDKYTKLRSLIKHLQKKIMEHFIPQQQISHDEAMVKYFGKHSCKQSMRNKPIRFSYKIFDKNERGYSECVSGTLEACTVKINRWKNNSVVTVASTAYGKVLLEYNKSIGGTDRMNQNVNCYRIG
ncbi:PiggyBac transposable element-derived protein, partial [Trinorchestia longiramus]